MIRFLPHRLRTTSMLCLTSALLPSSAAFAAQEVPTKATKVDPEETYRMLNLFGDVFDRVRHDYVEEVPDDKLIKAAINGMLTSLDPHSSYMDAKEFQEMQVQTRGEFGGLGIEVTMENGLVKVVSPMDETPAFRAGIKSGDYISHIDDEPVMGLTLSEAVEKMRGKSGTKITLTVLREGANEPLTFSMTREKIKIESVVSRNEGDDIIYLRVRSFAETTHDSLGSEFAKRKKELKGELKGIILDLRNNPGGLLDQAVAVSDDFLDHGEIVSTRGRDPENTTRFNAKEGEVAPEVPVVILVNNGTASASEIVSGALQDHHRAIVMGTETFGKGSVQTVIPLSTYGAMKLTTARYYTPSGRSIQAEGIHPDIHVDQVKVETIAQPKMRLEADLRGRLEKDETATNAAKKEGEATRPAIPTVPPSATPEITADEHKAGEMEDYQLSRALDLLRGLSIYGKKS